jgi:Flp pilus assembly protein CpaB
MAPKGKKFGKIIIYVAIILILAVVAIYLLSRNVGSTPTEQVQEVIVPQTETIDIVITTQKVGRGGEFTADVLTTIPYPRQEFVEGVFYTDINDVVGKWAKSDIEAHTPLTTDMVVASLTGSYAAFQVPKGMVAITIPILDRLSYVGYAPEAGDHINLIVSLLMVDLDTEFQSKLPNSGYGLAAPLIDVPDSPQTITTYPYNYSDAPTMMGRVIFDPTIQQAIATGPSETQRPRLVVQTLLQDVLILRVGDYKSDTSSGTVAAEPEPGIVNQENPVTDITAITEPFVLPDTITLVVTPQDAVTLTYLTYTGARYTLVLRSPGDDQRIITEAGTLQFLLDQYNIPLPTRLPYGIEPRIDTLILPSQFTTFPTPVPQE